MKLYRVKLIHSFDYPYPQEKIPLIMAIGLRICAVKIGGGMNGGLVLPNRLVALPIIRPKKTARIIFNNNTATVGKLVWADGEITLLKCPMTPNIGNEIGIDHVCIGEFLWSFHEKKLHMWEKQPHQKGEYHKDLVGVSIPLFTEDKHFAGFAIWNPNNGIHHVITDIILNPEGR